MYVLKKIAPLCIVILYVMIVSLSITNTSYAESTNKKESSKIEMLDEEDNFEEKVEMALKKMSSKNYEHVEQAIYFFESMGEDAVPYLIEKLENKKDNKRVRNNIIYTLGRLSKNARHAVSNIMAFLRSDDSETRGVAVVALGKIGRYSKAAVPALMLLLRDRDSWVQRKASEALRKIEK